MTTIEHGQPPSAAPAPAATAQRQPGVLVRVLVEAGDLARFSARSLRALGGVPRYSSEVFRQTALLMRGTLPFLAVMEMFFGFTIVNYSFFFFRTIGASDYVGLVVGLAGVRLGCLAMFGYVFSSKVACGIVAELGSAKINEEVDAYEVEGVDPYQYIIGTRIAATLLWIPVAGFVDLAALTFGGYLDSVGVLHGLTGEQFYSVNWASVAPSDVLYMFITIATVGLVLTLVACFYGFRTSGGPAAVGESVARSLIVNLTLAHVIPAIYVMNFYNITSPHLSIGG